MTTSKYLLVLIIVLIWISVLMNLFNVININFTEIITYTLLLLGITLFYPSFRSKYNPGIFIGSSVFLTGIVFFVSQHYELSDTSQLILPAIILVIAFSLMLNFAADLSDRKFLFIGLFLLVIGLFTLYDRGHPGVGTFISALVNLFGKFWIIALLAVVTIVVIKLEKKINQQK